jgi:hypothetical protein
MPTSLRYDSGHRWDTPGLLWDGDVPEAAAPNPTKKTMTPDDLVDIEMTAQHKADIEMRLEALEDIFSNYIIGLTPEQRRGLATIGAERQAMIADFKTSMDQHPELVPSWVNIPKLNKDLQARADLVPFFERLKELCEGADDTSLALGSDIYGALMAYYGNVQAAAKNGVPGADAVLATLKQHVPRGWKLKKNPPPTP